MTTKKTTALLSLVLVASFAGTMISIPQMIGPANAASCPDGSKPQQGKCVTVVGTPQCPADTQTSGNTCTKTYSSSGTAARQDCKRLGGNFDAQTKTCTNIPKQCSEGTLSSDGTQCVTFTKPGNP